MIVDRGELTLHVRREHLVAVAQVLRDEPSLAFELCSGVSGAHYLADPGVSCTPCTTWSRSRTIAGCAWR